jgi:hypothetical protein
MALGEIYREGACAAREAEHAPIDPHVQLTTAAEPVPVAVSPAMSVSPTAAISPAVVITVAITDEPGIDPCVGIKWVYRDDGRVHDRDRRHCDTNADNGLCFGGDAAGDCGHNDSGTKNERCEFKHGNSP